MRPWLCVSLLASTAFGQSVPTIHGIGNAAAYGSNVAGSIVAIYGSFFPAGRPVSASSVPLPVKLNGVQVTMNGISAPLFYVGNDQINAQVPWELAAASSLTARVVSQGVTSDAMTVPLSPAGPGVFVITSATDGSLVRVSSPANIIAPAAAPGQYLTIYSTGLGAVTNQPATGAVALSDPLSKSTLNTSVSIGGLPATVVFSGLTPGFAGLFQVNAQVPAGAAGGDSIPFALTVGGVSNRLTIGVQSSKLPSVPVSVSPSSASVQVSKTIQFTATAGSAVAWSVDTIAGGDSTVGTISNAGLYTAPPSLPFSDPAHTFTVSATSIANSASAASAAVNVTTQSTSQGPTITSVFPTSAIPMTTLQIRTTGLDAKAPVQVKFTGSSKYLVTEPALTVGSDGTVTVGVPLYVDLSRGQITTGTVSVSLTQGAQSSAAVPLSIQDLPPLSSYGAQPGQISDAVLALVATLEAQRLNQIQAVQQLPGNTIDTSQAQATLKKLLNATIAARSDVDRVAANSSLSINQGTRGDGVAIQFDQSALDLMDRANALFLSQTFAPLITAAPSANVQGERSDLRAANALFWVEQLINYTKTQGKVNDLILSAIKQDKARDMVAVLDAWATGAKVVADMIPESQLSAFAKQQTGLGLTVLADAKVIGETFGNLAAYTAGVVTHDQSIQDAAIAAMEASNSKGELYGTLFDLSVALIGGPTGSANIPHAEVIGNLFGLAKSFAELQVESWERADKISEDAAKEYAALAPDPRHGIAQVIGIAPPFSPLAGSPEQGITSPQSGTALCGFGSSSLCLTSLSDTAGNYTMYVPLQVPGTNYGTLSMNAQDPLSGASIGSEVVNLSGLDASKPVQVPTIIPQGSSGASLTWTVSGTASAAGISEGFSGTLTFPATGGSGKFSSGSTTVTASASGSTFSVSGTGFGSGDGVNCGGSASGSGPILSTASGFSAKGSLGGSAHCIFDDGSSEDFSISGSFTAIASK